MPASVRPALVRIASLAAAVTVAGALFVAPQLTDPAWAAPRHPEKVGQRWARHMLNHLNQERAAHHLRPLKMNARLIRSAHAHNLAMAADDQMSHQLPGEAYFAQRISRAGYDWSWAGENVGWNSDESNAGLIDLQRMMYAEQAPNDGHRRNILSRHYRQVGIDVYFDAAHGKMWFTQDFGRPAA